MRDCVRNDSSVRYALDDGRHVYPLSDREIPAKFAARKVQVTGVFHKNTGLLDIETITPLN